MKNYLRGLWQRCLTLSTEAYEKENLLDNKKDNFIITGTERQKKWFLCFKIKDKTNIIKQKFSDEQTKTGLGF